jgi:hypothetical protein
MSDLWATAMGVWSDDFADLMLPCNRLSLGRSDLVFMGNGTPGFSYSVTDPCPVGFSQMLKSDLTLVMAHFPLGAHLRLDLCSFRTGVAAPRVVGMNGAMWLMRQANPRVSGVIRQALADTQPLSLFVFPWLPIPHWAEYRIFIRHGAVIGMSQMHPTQVFPQIAQHETALSAALHQFSATILPRLKLPDVGLDVLAEPLAQGGFRIRLLDMAILGPRTDPCLFTWENGGDFDGTFRFRRTDAGASDLEKTMHPASVPAPPAAPDEDVWSI